MNCNYNFFKINFFAFSSIFLGNYLYSTTPIISEDLAAAVVNEISQTLKNNHQNLDETTSLIQKIIQTLAHHSLPETFHYVRELKNTIKFGNKIYCKNLCVILKELVLLWKKQALNLSHKSYCGITKDELTDFFFDVAIEDPVKFKNLKSEPDVFFQHLADKTIDKINNCDLDVTHKRLGEEIYFFVEILINKVVWSEDEPEQFWYEMWSLVSHLEDIAKSGIIEEVDKYSDFYCSLNSRLNYFLNTSKANEESDKNGYKMSDLFFKNGLSFIKNELSFSSHLDWLSLELEEWIAKRSLISLKNSQPNKYNKTTKKLIVG